MTTSEQARADAMADAETLRRCSKSTFIRKAALDGHVACLIATVAIYDQEPYGSKHFAREAARAAFRAVPGLRG